MGSRTVPDMIPSRFLPELAPTYPAASPIISHRQRPKYSIRGCAVSARIPGNY
jgi:hypothetical protein